MAARYDWAEPDAGAGAAIIGGIGFPIKMGAGKTRQRAQALEHDLRVEDLASKYARNGEFQLRSGVRPGGNKHGAEKGGDGRREDILSRGPM